MVAIDVATTRTSPITWIGIVLLAFAVAAPFIGNFIQDQSPTGSEEMLGAFFAWSVMGLGAGTLGVLCAIFGAWRGPRSGITRLAVAFALLWVVAVIVLMALLLR